MGFADPARAERLLLTDLGVRAAELRTDPLVTAIAAAADSAARAHLHTLNIPGRDRHAPRKQKARPKFPHTSATKQTVTGKYQVVVYAPGRG